MRQAQPSTVKRYCPLTFRAGMVGLERIHIVRLGSAQDYADVSAT